MKEGGKIWATSKDEPFPWLNSSPGKNVSQSTRNRNLGVGFSSPKTHLFFTFYGIKCISCGRSEMQQFAEMLKVGNKIGVNCGKHECSVTILPNANSFEEMAMLERKSAVADNLDMNMQNL